MHGSALGDGSLSLERIVAFNDELEALVRAGIPLERGLLAASSDYRGQLGRALRRVGGRLEAGERLGDAVAGSAAMPAIYRAVIEAGLRSGRLAEALQGLSQIGQAHLEARRTIALAFLYPLLVLILAYALFVGCVVEILPRFVAASTELGIAPSRVATAGQRLGATVAIWGPIPPLLLGALVVGWRWAGRARGLDGSGRREALLGWLPVVGPMLSSYRAANFADLLAHLVAHDVPLADAARLAGNASGSPSLRLAADRFADRLVAGDTLANGLGGGSTGLPPLVAWMLAANTRQGSLAPGLRHLATAYRRRADRQADALRIFLPGLMLLLIGALAVLAYGLLLFVPLRALWGGLADPTH